MLAALGIIKELIDGSITSGRITVTDKLFFMLLRYGDVYRSHNGELFHYDKNARPCGWWQNKKDSVVDMRPALGIVEGILYVLKEKVQEEQVWDWNVVSAALRQCIQNDVDTNATSITNFHILCTKSAKSNWDANLKTTQGKRYMAHSLAKLAEIVSALPVYYEQDCSKGAKSEIWRS